MDSKVPQYQRAVTPTLDSAVRGKVLSYNSNLLRGKSTLLGTEKGPAAGIALTTPGAVVARGSSGSPRSSLHPEINVQGRSTTSHRPYNSTSSGSSKGLAEALVGNSEPLSSLSVLPRYDLVPLSEEIPHDGIIFAQIRSAPDSLVVFRTPEERLRNPERLNLDRRQLEICPLLEQEQRLRLLNFQNNNIRMIQNLENLPNLIFLDLYNNRIISLEGPLAAVKGLRVLMAGKNKISAISNLQNLRKLDVLDLHSNEIRSIEGLDGLSDLRVLNLAGNRISVVNNLSSLVSLTELNLRRNNIEYVNGLNKLPALQRVFLSHNLISSIEDINCLMEVTYLIELSLDGNPLSEASPEAYRSLVVARMPGLRHLDLRRITDEERSSARTDLASRTLAAEGDVSVITPSASASGAATEAQTYRPAQYSEDDSNVLAVDGGDGDSASLPVVRRKAEGAAGEDTDGTLLGKGREVRSHSDTEEAPRPGRLDRSGKYPTGAPSPVMQGNYFSGDHRAAVEDENKMYHSKRAGLESRTVEECPSELSSSPSVSGGAAAAGATLDAAVATSSSHQQDRPLHPPSLADMARAGKLSSTQDFFDLEIIGPDEKALIAVGEVWDWTCSKRLLQNVTEATLYQMRLPAILSKFGPTQISSMSSVKTLRLFRNDFQSLKSIDFLPRLWGCLEHLVVKDNPVCTVSSGLMLRAFLVASMPSLRSFNDEVIHDEERQQAIKTYAPLLEMLQVARANELSLQMGANRGVSNGSKSGASSGRGIAAPSQVHQQPGPSKRRGTAPSIPPGASRYGDSDPDRSDVELGSAYGSAPPLSFSGDFICDANIGSVIAGLQKRAILSRKQYEDFSAIFDDSVKSIISDALEGLKKHR